VTKDHRPLRKLSAGIVIVRSGQHGPHVLCLRAFRHWDFPKGLVEAGEEPLAAAIREAAEETSLADLDFAWGQEFRETEPYAGGKVARYYVARLRSGEVRLPINPALGRPEHNEFRWLDFDDARPLLVPRLQKIIDWARVITRARGHHLSQSSSSSSS
jgi:8-oxo-dGTP pyrophosphatase MutT (NUDIX family)